MDYYRNIDIPLPKVGNWAEEKYKRKTGSLLKTPSASYGIFPDDEIRASLIAYAAGLSFVDEQIGRIIEMLIETGQFENTLILYTSDHGDMMGDQHMWRKGRPYEPSTRIPFIIRWPESFKPYIQRGQNRFEVIVMSDIFPTFADVANIEISSPIDGESVFKIFKQNINWRKIIDMEHARIYEPDNAWVALTDGKHKYIYFILTGEEQLFNLDDDPYELSNIASDPKNRKLRKWWYGQMVNHLKVRGEYWIRGNKLQIQKNSILKGKNFPENNSCSN